MKERRATTGWLEELEALKRKNLYREIFSLDTPNDRSIEINGTPYLNFSSNNYLGLANNIRVRQAAHRAIEKWGTGSGASRLISGNLKIHEDLEKNMAAFKGEEKALIFSSGYLANLGAITAVVGQGDLVIVDRLNHASLIDAARLSRAKLWVYPHRDISALKKLLNRAKAFRRRLVVTDAYFSMDGTIAPLDELVSLCKKTNTLLMADEAHSVGVYGKNGGGLTEKFGVTGKVDIVMGTLSKALGSVGGYIAGSKILVDYLINQAREFIYTTGPAPAASAAASAALAEIKKRKSLRENLLRGHTTVSQFCAP